MNLDATIKQYIELVERELLAAIPSEAAGLPAHTSFYRILHYHLGWTDAAGQPLSTNRGKRIRPLLCMLCCEAAGGDYRQAVPLGTAIELLHNFTLIHDDIQDRSEERRHRPTVWKIWGEAQAINAGDAMYALALLELRRLEGLGVAAAFINEVVSDLNNTMFVLAEGQYLDISFEPRVDVTIEEYLAMIERKTAALIGSAAWLGALLGAGNRETAEYYRSFGRGLGIAFQIQDDILGIWGDPRETGKPAGDDIIQRKKTLPLIFALRAASAGQNARLLDVYGKESVPASAVDEVKDLLELLGSKEYAEKRAQEWYRDALLCLDRAAPLPDAGQKLRTFASALLNRDR